MGLKNIFGLTNWGRTVAADFFMFARNLFTLKYPMLSAKQLMELGYRSNPFVFMTVDKIADVTSRLPYVFTDSNGEIVENSDESELWKSPSDNIFGHEFRHKILTDIYATGRAFVRGNTADISGTGKYAEFEHLPSCDVEIKYTNDGYTIKSYILSKPNGAREVIENIETVLHLALPDASSWKKEGMSPLQPLWSVVSASTALFQAEDSIFKNRGVNEILTNSSDQPMRRTEREQIQADFQDQTAGTDKFGQVMITNASLKNLKLGMSPSDLKLLESAIQKMRIICSAYGLDSSLFNDPENKTYSNRTEAQKAAYEDVYIPIAESYIILAFNKWWLADNWGSDLRLALDKSRIGAIKQVNKDLSDKLVNEVQAGVLTPEEAKEKLYG